MVFNWFRRKFDKSETEQVATPELETEVVEAAPAETAAELELASEGVATDYLAWAKAAYENIQQQESLSTAVVAVEEPAITDEEPVVVPTTDPELVTLPPTDNSEDEPIPVVELAPKVPSWS
jgi:fused signal recognition particle receptor